MQTNIEHGLTFENVPFINHEIKKKLGNNNVSFYAIVRFYELVNSCSCCVLMNVRDTFHIKQNIEQSRYNRVVWYAVRLHSG